MKTPDEIKKGIECCSKYLACAPTEDCCDVCPYMGCCSDLEKDALAYIQQLEADIEIQEIKRNAMFAKAEQLEAKVPKWISVKDKMPPTGNAVLVVVHNAKMAWICVEVDVWDGRWLENADSEWHIVTHWMPLPEPPEV